MARIYISKIALILLKLWIGLKFLLEGFEKFESLEHFAGRHNPFLDFYLAMGHTGYMLPFIGVVEIAGGLLLITQRYSLIGSFLLLPVALNVVFAHTFLIQDPLGIALTSIFFLSLLLFIFLERKILGVFIKGSEVWPMKKIG